LSRFDTAGQSGEAPVREERLDGRETREEIRPAAMDQA